jgi:hypothetical protein
MRTISYRPRDYYNHYSSLQEKSGGTWNTLDYDHAVYDSTTNIANKNSSSTGSSGSSTYYFNTDGHLLHSSYGSTTHSGNVSFGDIYYYYYLTHGQRAICPAAADTLSVESGMLSYSWNNGDTTYSTVVLAPGMYQCDIINQWGLYYQSEPHYMIAVANPVIDLGSDTTICINTVLQIDPGNFPSLVWHDGSTDSVYAYQSANADTENVFVTITDSNGCSSSDTINIVVDLCTGISEFALNEPYAFPNPTYGLVRLNFDSNTSHYIKVFDQTGRTVIELEIKGEENEVDLTACSDGVYYFIIEDGSFNKIIQKVIKTSF